MLGLACGLLVALPLPCWFILNRVFNPPLTPTIESKLAGLYSSNRFADVVSGCDEAENDDQYKSSRPRILYVQWAAERKLGDIAVSDRVEDTFLREFPEHFLAADMYFKDAKCLLADGQYEEADKKLAMIEDRFPQSPIVDKVQETRKSLKILITALPQ
jgi:hypothetical protein